MSDAVDAAGRLAGEVAVERLAEARGVELAPGGDGMLVGACPLCSTGGGLVVERAANRWACSGCGEGGGPLEWVMATEGVSRTHAVELLREGLPEPSTGRPPKVGSRVLLPAPFEPCQWGTSEFSGV